MRISDWSSDVCSSDLVIPARYASSRLPGKPLVDISGKPMVVRVVEQALASGAVDVVVATDHKEVAQTVRDYGYHVAMKRSEERRVGKEGVSRCRYRWAQYNQNIKKRTKIIQHY